MHARPLGGLVLAGVVVFACAAPHAAQAFDPTKDRETHLLSRSFTGGFPNGPSRNPKFSKDGQGARFASFESDASDIVRGDTNGATDVFLVRRGGRFTTDKGEPWQPAGPAELVSVARDGGFANGRSYLPDMDGSALVRFPRCIAFVSEASNLVEGDTNGKADAFVRDLRAGVTTRVSVDADGHESDGRTYDVQLDGRCSRVAFTSDATNLHIPREASREHPLVRPLATSAPPRGTKQIYVHFLDGRGDNTGLAGLTFLASASKRGVPGERDSYDVSLGQLGGGCKVDRCGTTSGDSLSFTSDSENLTEGDRNGQADIYQRDFYRRVLRPREQRRGKVAYFRTRTSLVSQRSGIAGNGASTHSVTNDRGSFVAFETVASDLVPNDRNNASDVVMRGMHRNVNKRMWHASRAFETGQANGGSYNPTITSPASILFYESDASNLQPNPASLPGVYHDRNCARDVFFWNYVSTNASLQSRDSNQRIPNLPENTGGLPTDSCPATVASGSTNPAASYYGNYFMWESSYPLLDLPLVERALPHLKGAWTNAAAESLSNDALHQVYLRYNGPKEATATFPPSVWPLP